MESEGIDLSLRLQTSATTSQAPLAAARAGARSLYVHVPFCFHKCHYCDFYSIVDRQDRQEQFIDALVLELAVLSRFAASPLRTIFVGGGTPTLLRVDLWNRLLRFLADRFDCSSPELEFTVECNPETASPDLLHVLARGGVNRLSIGAQSFDRRHLDMLERQHDPAGVQPALRMASDAGIQRRSIDLIFAIPGQTIEQWDSDLSVAIDLEPSVEHVSCYGLTYEPLTRMTVRRDRGEFVPCEEEIEAQMYEHAVARLEDAGYQRYEVSNFAAHGAECRHNLAYWRGEQWLAAGPSASSHVGGHRWKNMPHLSQWIDGVRASGGFSPIIDHEPPNAQRALVERLMMGLRLREGIEPEDRLIGTALDLERAGLLTLEKRRWLLTDRGFLMADLVVSRLMDAHAAPEAGDALAQPTIRS